MISVKSLPVVTFTFRPLNFFILIFDFSLHLEFSQKRLVCVGVLNTEIYNDTLSRTVIIPLLIFY